MGACYLRNAVALLEVTADNRSGLIATRVALKALAVPVVLSLANIALSTLSGPSVAGTTAATVGLDGGRGWG